MSDNEAHKGKLVPMILSGVSMEERAQSACELLGIEATGAHANWIDCLKDRGYRKAYIRGDIIYRIDNTELDAYGFSEANKNGDGSIDYVMMYYNGGGSFDEVLDEAMKRLENKDD